MHEPARVHMPYRFQYLLEACCSARLTQPPVCTPDQVLQKVATGGQLHDHVQHQVSARMLDCLKPIDKLDDTDVVDAL